MCGEEDEAPTSLEDNLYTAFLAHARALLSEHARLKGRDPESAAGYADALFAAALRRGRSDCEAREPAERYETMAM